MKEVFSQRKKGTRIPSEIPSTEMTMQFASESLVINPEAIEEIVENAKRRKTERRDKRVSTFTVKSNKSQVSRLCREYGRSP